ncbi:MAG: penicillin-binding protein [Chlamydiae bacterium]|nr:penicillin-binding protein [Chlamydiota bacterium]MBI3267015.1 penicillin-binding protein [Chlamydiota bacterium]
MVKFTHKFRSLLVAIFLLGALTILVIRLFFLQVLWHDFFVEKASQQQRLTIPLPPKRGKIVDCQGRDLAISVPVKSFYAVPAQVKDPEKVAKVLAKALNVDRKIILKRFSKEKHFVWIKRKIEPDKASEVIALKLPGIYTLEESRRVYPGGKLLGHVLGFTGLDDQGLEGLELKFDRYLRGKPGWRLTEKDATGREVLTSRRFEVEPQDGLDLILTIDATIQTLAEAQLDKVMEQFNPQSASLVVMNPKSGDILAFVNRPSYDVNQASKTSLDVRRDRALTDFFEPGSTLKPLIVSAALEEGVVKLSDRFYCEKGSFSIGGGHVLHDAHPYGTLAVHEIVSKSSNIGMAKIGCRLGAKNLYNYMSKFGFGRMTGVDLPGEVSGLLHPLSKWSKLSPYMIPMGQEMTVTAMQLVRAYCALANGGVLVKPRLIRKIVDRDGNVILENLTEKQDRVISRETVDQIVEAMKGVVSSQGTGYNARVDGYSVAGKTGTAQKADPAGGYSHSKFVSSFIGFLPADHPEAVILVVVNEPQHFHYGGTVAAPAFQELASALMRYLEVVPDRMLAREEENTNQ